MNHQDFFDKNSNFIPTLNKTGYVSTQPGKYCQHFIEFALTFSDPVADLGVGYGFTTRQALNAGLTVYANDLEKKHLEVLWQSISKEQQQKLYLFPGHIPEQIDFQPETFSAILAERWFHLLTGSDIETAAQKFYQWLKKGGKAFVVAETPYLGALENFIPIYEDRKKRGDPWPGWLEDWKPYSNRSALPDWSNLLDRDVLKRTFEKVGFEIECLEYIARPPYFPDDIRLDNRESVGIVVIK